MAAISWKTGISGSWTLGSNWSSGTVPGSGDDATIGIAGPYTVSLTASISANSITISDTQATLGIANPGGTETVAGDLANSGTLSLDAANGSVGSNLSVAGSLTNSGLLQLGFGPGNGAGGSTLSVTGTLTNSGTLNVFNDAAPAAILTAAGLMANTGTINLDAVSTGAADLILTSGVAPGTLSSTVTLFGPSLLEYASGGIATIANTGKLTVGNTNAFVADSGATTSNSALSGLSDVAGTFELQYGGSVSLSGGLTVGGTLSLDDNNSSVGSTLSVAGNLTNSGLLQLGRTFNAGGGSTLSVTGTLTNSGTLDVFNDAAPAAILTAAGLVANTGTINLDAVSTGAADLILTSGAPPGTLTSTVTLFGPSLLEFASGGIATIANTGELIVGNTNAFVADSGTLTSNSALTGLSDVAGTFELQYGGSVSLSGGLTIGGTLSLDDNNSSVGSTLSVAGNLTNSGLLQLGRTFNAGGGSTLSVTGTLTNSGTLDVFNDAAPAAILTAAGLVANTGTINLDAVSTGAADLILTSGAPPGTLTSTVTLFGPSLLEFASGGIATIANTGELIVGNTNAFVADSGTLTSNSALTGLSDVAGTFELQYGGSVSLSGGLTIGGTLSLDDNNSSVGSTLSVAGNLTNSGLLQLGRTFNAGGGSTLSVTGTLTNSGTLDVFNDAAPAAILTAAGLVANTGTINLDAVSTGAADLILTSGAPPGTLTSTVTLFGPSLLEFASGGIATIANTGELIVGNTNAFVADSGTLTSNSALTGLSDVAGTFELQYGGSVSLSGGLTIGGTLSLDDNNSSVGSTLSVAGNLTNSGLLQLGRTFNAGGGSTLSVTGTLTNSGTLDVFNDAAPAAILTAAGLVANTGTINLDAVSTGAADLILTSGMAPGTLTSTVTLFGPSLLEYASGGIATIANTGKLIVGNTNAFVADSGATTSNSALTGLSDVAGTFALQYGGSVSLSGGLTVGGTLSLDDNNSSVGSTLSVAGNLTNSGLLQLGRTFNAGGGSALSVTGTLTNSGTLDVFNDAAPAAILTAAGLVANTGTINLDAVSTGAADLILTSGVAPGTLSSTVTLFGPSLLEYASGGIATIANTGKLIVGNTNAFVADSGATTSNSALTGLSDVAGTFELQYGGSVSLSGGLTIGGTLSLDDNNSSVGSTLSVAGNLTNSGLLQLGRTFNAGGGSTLSVTGTLTNSGTLDVFNDAAPAAILTAAGLVANTGTINLDAVSTGAADLILTSGVAPGTLSSTVTLFGPSLLEYASGGIATIANTGKLIVGNTNAFVADSGATTSNSALTGLSDVAGTFALQYGGSVSLSGGLTVGGTLSLDDNNSSVGSTLSVAGNLTNSGLLQLGRTFNAGGGSTLSVTGTLTNSGTLDVFNDAAPAATLTAANLANTRTINLDAVGSGAADLILSGPGVAGSSTGFNTGTITSNDSGIAVNGGARLVNGSSGSAAGLISAGSDGVVLSNGGSLTNYGIIKGSQAGAYLEPAGSTPGAGVALTNYGLVSGATGIIDGGSTGTADTIVNHGTITGTTGAGVTLGGGTDRVDNFGTITGSNGTAVAFGSGTATVVVEPGAVFTGVLGGLGKSDLIDFAHVTATNFSFVNGTLTVLNNGAAVETLSVSGTFGSADLGLVSDGNGGVEIGIKPFGSIITGTYYTAILLSNPVISNSLTVTQGGRIAPAYGDAVVGGAGTAGTVTNLGTITAAGSSSVGVYLGGGGLVTNGAGGFSGGYISGSSAGVRLAGATGTVVNSGTIAGGSGIVIGNTTLATVTNAGTITGTSGTAVALAGGSNRLIVDPGAVFSGVVDGGGGSSVLEIAVSGSGLGSSDLFGALGAANAAAYVSLGSVQNFSALQVDSSATLDGSGALSFATVTNQGQINVASGDSLAIGTVASAANPGTINLFGGGTVTFSGAVAPQTLGFNSVGGLAAIDQPGEFLGTTTDFAAGDTIDLPLAKAIFLQYSAGVLSLSYLGATVDLSVATPYASPQFLFTADNAGGTDITVQASPPPPPPPPPPSPPPPPPPCYCRGTLIRTEAGEVPVERLAIGDRVVTLSGALKPVVWIGFGRSLVTRRNSEARPIIVRRGALGDNVPARDLYLSHGHALYLGGVLIPVEHLVNHCSIRWDEAARVVEYYHVELADHDVLFAEGAPAETYHDSGNRAFFHNARPGPRAGADKPTFAPVLHGGDRAGEVWAGLFARAGGRIERNTTDDSDLHLILDGKRIDPTAVPGGVYHFAVPRPPAATLRLVSRAGVPSLLGLGRHDHRPLGIAIERIILDHAGIATAFDYDAPQLREAGCHPPEDGYSWTAGDLELPIRFFSLLNGCFTLVVHTKPHYDMRYPISQPVARAA